jgi:hypothetical protein
MVNHNKLKIQHLSQVNTDIFLLPQRLARFDLQIIRAPVFDRLSYTLAVPIFQASFSWEYAGLKYQKINSLECPKYKL